MEALKQIINEQKKNLSGTYKCQGDILKVKIEEQQRKEQESSIRQKEKMVEKFKNRAWYNGGENLETVKNEELQGPPLKKEEIIYKLRQLNLPATLFGETNLERYYRLKKAETKFAKEEIAREDNTSKSQLKKTLEKAIQFEKHVQVGELSEMQHPFEQEVETLTSLQMSREVYR